MSQREQMNYVHQHKNAVSRHAARTAKDCAGFLIPYLQKLPADFKYLDLGCGPGSITLDLAQAFPAATFVGIDSGEGAIEHANTLTGQRGVKNATFSVGDIMNLGPSDIAWGAYDVVYCHQVLVHMRKPIEGLKIMQRAAKPQGGIVAARESFYSGQLYYPDTELMKEFTRLSFAVIEKNGSDPEFGKKLVAAALEAGWKRDQITSSFGVSHMTDEVTKEAFGGNIRKTFMDGTSSTRQIALRTGLVKDEKVFTDIAGEMERWLADETAWAAFVSGEIICVNGQWWSHEM